MERIAVAHQALKSLECILDEPVTVIVRDATIQRIDEDLALSLLQLVEDRNRTSHAYVEAVAISVFERIPQHAKSLRSVLESINN